LNRARAIVFRTSRQNCRLSRIWPCQNLFAGGVAIRIYAPKAEFAYSRPTNPSVARPVYAHWLSSRIRSHQHSFSTGDTHRAQPVTALSAV
jgi:hypothetical protein